MRPPPTSGRSIMISGRTSSRLSVRCLPVGLPLTVGSLPDDGDCSIITRVFSGIKLY